MASRMKSSHQSRAAKRGLQLQLFIFSQVGASELDSLTSELLCVSDVYVDNDKLIAVTHCEVNCSSCFFVPSRCWRIGGAINAAIQYSLCSAKQLCRCIQHACDHVLLRAIASHIAMVGVCALVYSRSKQLSVY
jgi:hypothetical protein